MSPSHAYRLHPHSQGPCAVFTQQEISVIIVIQYLNYDNSLFVKPKSSDE